ncbi:MAG: AAA family ATPase [Paracoccaceae bacterium]
MKRVMVVGGPGSGKSTLAVKLGKITGLPVFHMDLIHHLPGWVERPRADKLQLAHNIEESQSWIFEGGLSATFKNRASRADTLIWLDLPLGIRLARILKRRVQYHNKPRPDVPENCPEHISFEFTSYIIRTRNSHREKIAQTIADAPHLKVHHIRTAKGADTLLEWLTDEHQTHN